MRILLAAAAAAVALVPALTAGAGAPTGSARAAQERTEVVVTLASPPLAYASTGRASAAQRLDAEQRRFRAQLALRLPDAQVRWRYRLVANGFAVLVAPDRIAALEALPGVRAVTQGTSYRAAARATEPGAIGAPALWGGGLATAGQGVKIAIIDDGVDQRHPFFSPRGYAMPAGFPKGQVGYTTAKVIVARSFPPPGASWRHAAKPFDPEESGHATHVAGIAAGNYRTPAGDGRRVSGVAPRAYIGNYKALTVPTESGLGLNGNAPELVAAIEAAVADGMDVINLSLGEPEIEPGRDVVALALDAAAAAGVVPVAAAGNDGDVFGAGTVASPGSAARAITVAAAAIDAEGARRSSFSGTGPTALSRRLKPDVTAPGDGILSSVPGGGWTRMSGTSMAAPHVSGGVALLLQRHPDWSVDQVKSALVATARGLAPGVEETPTAVGAGLVDLAAADRPLVGTAPASLGWSLAPGASATQTVTLTDAGGGAGTWSVTVDPAGTGAAATLQAPPTVVVPGSLAVTAVAAGTGDTSGALVLARDGVTRRVPFLVSVSVPALRAADATPLRGPGVYRGDTRGRPALVTRYRYPEVPPGGIVTARLWGPEQLFRLDLRRPVANFGVVITSRGRGVTVEPRVVAAADENRLTGYAALPVNMNPYVEEFEEPTPVAGALGPVPGRYDVVFDSHTKAGAGSFTFRLWVDDVTPPRVRLLTRSVARRGTIVLEVTDAGSGADPRSREVQVDGRSRVSSLTGRTLRVPAAGLKPGRHVLRVRVSDYQETRNTENVARILPNTRTLRTVVVVRGR